MYSIISLISAWIRQFYLPNPFATIITNSLYADIFNIFVGGFILHKLSYGITSIYYNKGENPIIGSISYFIWYVINTLIFIEVGKITNSCTMYISLLIIIYLIIIITINNIIKSKSDFITKI